MTDRGHRASLDGLRFLAFLAVFWFHARPDRCPWGWGGVRVFFALSGFLIARILIRGETGDRGADLRRFYIRRTLRIFPLYYAIVLWIWINGELTQDLWYLAYLPNVKAYLDSNFNPMLGHFWTLGVEEQFYILFPLLLLTTPGRFRVALLVALIAGSAGFQAYAHDWMKMPWAKWLLPYCGEDLAWGALAGLIELRTRTRRGVATALVVAGSGMLGLGWLLNEHRVAGLASWAQDDLSPTCYGIGGAALVFGLWRTTNPVLTWPLSVAPVAYLGRISYGLYAFHVPVLHGGWTNAIPYAFFIPQPYRDLGWTIVLAAVSWRFFEGQINRLKDRSAPAGSGG